MPPSILIFEKKKKRRGAEPGILKRPVKVLTNLLKNSGAYLRERHFSVLCFSKTTCHKQRKSHIISFLKNHATTN